MEQFFYHICLFNLQNKVHVASILKISLELSIGRNLFWGLGWARVVDIVSGLCLGLGIGFAFAFGFSFAPMPLAFL